MAQEIERKFLVRDDSWRAGAIGVLYCQGYLKGGGDSTVRVRVAGDRAYLTVKGATTGITRLEFEYEIPVADANQLLTHLCGPSLIEKLRYRIPVADHLWEVDEFLGANAGLVLAEVELTTETEAIVLPLWVGEEVSHDPRYYNACLAQTPYTTWQG